MKFLDHLLGRARSLSRRIVQREDLLSCPPTYAHLTTRALSPSRTRTYARAAYLAVGPEIVLLEVSREQRDDFLLGDSVDVGLYAR